MTLTINALTDALRKVALRQRFDYPPGEKISACISGMLESLIEHLEDPKLPTIPNLPDGPRAPFPTTIEYTIAVMGDERLILRGSKEACEAVINIHATILTARDYLGYVASILADKREDGGNIHTGSADFKSLERWANEAMESLGRKEKE